MSKIGQTKQEDPIESTLAICNEFEAGFQRSCRDNLYRKYESMTVTVFGYRNERFGWCIADDEENKRYSATQFETEEEALESLGAQFFA